MDNAILGTHFSDYLTKTELNSCQASLNNYLKFFKELEPSTGIPYKNDKSNPTSLFYSITTLSNLLDINEENNEITEDLILWLVKYQQDNGLWKDDIKLKEINNLPSWYDPSNTSVSIFNTCSAAAVLSRIHSYDIQLNLDKAVKYIGGMTSENGSIFGFPQSTWIVTPAISRVYGLSSSRFLLHWSILNDFVSSSQSLGNISTIARSLVNSFIEPEDILLGRSTELLLKYYNFVSIDFAGWNSEDGKLNAKSSLGVLYILNYANLL